LEAASQDQQREKRRLRENKSTKPHQGVEMTSIRERLHNAVIRVYDATGDVIETREHTGDFREW